MAAGTNDANCTSYSNQLANWLQKGSPIQFRDELNIPNMNWPITRLRYTVNFAGAGASATNLHLRDIATGKAVTFQLSDVQYTKGLIQKANLNFLFDLPVSSVKLQEYCRSLLISGWR
ncbi:hypothetical protein G8759_15300 [Spirosoma aureum]|uniref:Uncharacterized protein n=1 Tax=Spirosoma aureum TaxID=2692134 RepID=A0A6G9ANA3_9BACT|nr:hypothetical protein [Spirosoma aureum]QIP13880.1 hypothetical protein G8759_15300 [Spirosoma aureum]